jgi:hypothetical protein
MNSDDYTQDIVVSCSANTAYRALTSEYNQWWTPDTDSVSSVGDTIKFKFDSTYWVMRANTLSPNYIELECIEAHHIHDGLPASILKEWEGTKLKWEIQEQNGSTKIILMHEGLLPSLDCFDICKDGWDFFFVTSLKKYLNEGKGSPYGAEE